MHENRGWHQSNTWYFNTAVAGVVLSPACVSSSYSYNILMWLILLFSCFFVCVEIEAESERLFPQGCKGWRPQSLSVLLEWLDTGAQSLSLEPVLLSG